jgi:hypothetical protein
MLAGVRQICERLALVAEIRVADGDGTSGKHDGFAVDQASRRFRPGQPAITSGGVNPEHRESRGAFNQLH